MSDEGVSLVIDILSFATLIGIATAVFLFLVFISSFFSSSQKGFFEQARGLIATNALSFIFLFAGVATLGSLFLSEIAGFAPCKLCWYQRIFMYPVAILSGLGLFWGDKKVVRYVIVLASIGLVIAIYHYVMQMVPGLIQCSDEVASCSAKQFANFGFITIPFMSLVAFVNIILLSLLSIREK